MNRLVVIEGLDGSGKATQSALLEDALKNRGYAVNFRTYPMEHAVCPQQIGHISEALQRFLIGES